MDKIAAQISSANALELLRDITTHTYRKLINQGYTAGEIGEEVPPIEILKEITRQHEPVCSRLQAEIKENTFRISSSHKFSVLWNRRRYYIGPKANSYTLPVARQIIDYVNNQNKALTRTQWSAGDDMREHVHLLYWDNFDTNDDNIRSVMKGEIWRKVYNIQRSNAVSVVQNKDERPNVKDIFRVSNLIADSPETGERYEQRSKSVTTGYSAAKATSVLPPEEVKAAMKIPPAPPVTEDSNKKPVVPPAVKE